MMHSAFLKLFNRCTHFLVASRNSNSLQASVPLIQVVGDRRASHNSPLFNIDLAFTTARVYALPVVATCYALDDHFSQPVTTGSPKQ